MVLLLPSEMLLGPTPGTLLDLGVSRQRNEHWNGGEGMELEISA